MPPKKSTPKTNAPISGGNSQKDNTPIRIRLIKKVMRNASGGPVFHPGLEFDITPAEIKARRWKTSDYEVVSP